MLGGRMNSRQSRSLRFIQGVLKGVLLGLPIGGLILVLTPFSSQMNVPLAHLAISGLPLAGGLWEIGKPHWLLQTWKQSLARFGLRPDGRVGSHRCFSGTIDGRRVIWSLPTEFRTESNAHTQFTDAWIEWPDESPFPPDLVVEPCTHRYWYGEGFRIEGLEPHVTAILSQDMRTFLRDTVQRYSFRISGRRLFFDLRGTHQSLRGADIDAERDQIIDMVQRLNCLESDIPKRLADNFMEAMERVRADEDQHRLNHTSPSSRVAQQTLSALMDHYLHTDCAQELAQHILDRGRIQEGLIVAEAIVHHGGQALRSHRPSSNGP